MKQVINTKGESWGKLDHFTNLSLYAYTNINKNIFIYFWRSWGENALERGRPLPMEARVNAENVGDVYIIRLRYIGPQIMSYLRLNNIIM